MELVSLPDIMTAHQLADIMKISRMTVYRALKNGDLKGFKAGRSRRFAKEAVLQWINTSTSTYRNEKAGD